MEINEDFFIGLNKTLKENELFKYLDVQHSDLFTWFFKKFSRILSSKFKEMTILLFNRLSNHPLLQKETEKIFLISLARISYKIHGNLQNDSIALNTFVDILQEEVNAFISVTDLNQTEIFLMNLLNWEIKLDTLSSHIDRLLSKIQDSFDVIIERNSEIDELLNSFIEAALINLSVNVENVLFFSTCIVITLLEIITGNDYITQMESYKEFMDSSVDTELLKETSILLKILSGYHKNRFYLSCKDKSTCDFSTKESYYSMSSNTENKCEESEMKRSRSIDNKIKPLRSEKIGIKPVRKYFSSKNLI